MNPSRPAPPSSSVVARILTDIHLWVPVIVLILGTVLLMTLK